MSGKDAIPVPAPKAKKLPFKPTALHRYSPQIQDHAKNSSKSGDDGLELFRRGKEMQPIVEADRERRLKKKQQKLEEERRKSFEATATATTTAKRLFDSAEDEHSLNSPRISPADARTRTPMPEGSAKDAHAVRIIFKYMADQLESELATPPASKRTRLSSPASIARNRSFNSTGADMGLNGCISSVPSPRSSVERLASEDARRGKILGSTATPVLLSDSEEEGDEVQIISAQTRLTNADNDDDDEDEDDEFAEYVRKADEQRARNQLLASRGDAEGKESIEILVEPTMAGGKPCCVKFFFDKPLRVVRDTWLAIQKTKGILMDVEDGDGVVLTWRRRKVYASSTLITIGIRPQGNGRATADGMSTNGRGLDASRTRVHMEAWTLEAFQEMERQEDHKRQMNVDEDADDPDGASTEERTPEPEMKLRVILKARGLSDVKLTVRPETTVETLLTGFRAQRPVSPGKDVGLWFDGARLEEHVTMDEAEIDDMDTFEVHIR